MRRDGTGGRPAPPRRDPISITDLWLMGPAPLTSLVASARTAFERQRELRRVDKVSGARLRHLPTRARAFVIAVYVAAVVSALTAPMNLPDVPIFILLMVTSAVASGQKIRLPLGSSSSNLSI